MNSIPELLNSTVLKEVGALKNIARAVFKWLSKVNTSLLLLRLVIGLKFSCQFFNQRGAKAKPTAPCTCDFSHAWSKMKVTARNWLVHGALFAPVVIGRSNYFGIGSSTVIWKPLYEKTKTKRKQTLTATAFPLSSSQTLRNVVNESKHMTSAFEEVITDASTISSLVTSLCSATLLQ